MLFLHLINLVWKNTFKRREGYSSRISGSALEIGHVDLNSLTLRTKCKAPALSARAVTTHCHEEGAHLRHTASCSPLLEEMDGGSVFRTEPGPGSCRKGFSLKLHYDILLRQSSKLLLAEHIDFALFFPHTF